MLSTGPVTGLCMDVLAWVRGALDGFPVASYTGSRPCCVGAEAYTQKHIWYVISPTFDATPTEMRGLWSYDGAGMPTTCKVPYGHHFDEMSGRLEMIL